jgi:hypothetical protein
MGRFGLTHQKCAVIEPHFPKRGCARRGVADRTILNSCCFRAGDRRDLPERYGQHITV